MNDEEGQEPVDRRHYEEGQEPVDRRPEHPKFSRKLYLFVALI
jgi:hypothetical protein